MSWQIICPDGRRRHFLYRSKDDAIADVQQMDKYGCTIGRLPSEIEKPRPPCEGVGHTVIGFDSQTSQGRVDVDKR